MTQIKTHYLPVYKPHPTNPTIIGYNVWAYMGHVLLGKICENQFVATIYQARKKARELRAFYNRGE